MTFLSLFKIHDWIKSARCICIIYLKLSAPIFAPRFNLTWRKSPYFHGSTLGNGKHPQQETGQSQFRPISRLFRHIRLVSPTKRSYLAETSSFPLPCFKSSCRKLSGVYEKFTTYDEFKYSLYRFFSRHKDSCCSY